MVDVTSQIYDRPEPGTRAARIAARNSRLGRLLIYLALPPVTIRFIMWTAGGDTTIAIVTSMLALAAFWIGFSRANPRIVGLELIGVILSTYYWINPPIAVLWVTASAMAAALGVWLQNGRSAEGHYFFLVPAAAGACFVLLVWLGAGASLSPALMKARYTLKQDHQAVTAMKAGLDEKTEQGRLMRSMIDAIEPNFDVVLVTVWLVLWTLAIWVAGRLSRSVLGQFHGRRHSIAFFRIEHSYIFLLIIGLILEILNGLAPRWGMQWLAIPLLSVFALACYIEGLAVVLFYGALQRLKGRRWGGRVWSVAGVVVALCRPELAILVGLSDVWFDYRRLSGLRQRIDYQA